MASKYFIYSTLTADQKYTAWTTPEKGGIPAVRRQVLIRGGTNVANKFLVTPRGVCTEVSEEDYGLLQQDHTFLLHKKNGFITVREEKVDPEVAVAADMEQKDASAPLTPESTEFEEQGGAPPKKDAVADEA